MNEEASNAEERHQHQWVVYPPTPSQNMAMRFVTHLTFHPSVQVIPKFAFKDHRFLERVRIPNTILTIGQKAFSHSHYLSQVEFQDGLQIIEKWAFHSCYDLEEVRMPSTVKVIGEGAFAFCNALTYVQLPRGLKVLQQATFRYCKALTEISLPDGLCVIEASAFYACESLEKAKIPDSVKAIGKSAFEKCTTLTCVKLSRGLKKICERAFASCSQLSGIVLPSSLEEIEHQAFMSCISLFGVEFAKDGHVNIHPHAFIDNEQLVNVCLPGEIDNFASVFFKWMESLYMLPSSLQTNIEPFSEQNQLHDEDGHVHIRERFTKLPVHSLCYHSSVTTLDELKQAVDGLYALNSTEWNDYLGLTPFHIVATSANPRVDMLEYLLKCYPIEVLAQQDRRGYTMMDYLVMNAVNGTAALNSVLRVVFSEFLLLQQARHNGKSLSHRELKMKLQDEIKSDTNSVFKGQYQPVQVFFETTTDKRARVRKIFERIGFHMQREQTIILELASWKRRMVEARKETRPSTEGTRRETCRYQCGSGVVIDNVKEYLGQDESAYLSSALSVFPFCTIIQSQRKSSGA